MDIRKTVKIFALKTGLASSVGMFGLMVHTFLTAYFHPTKAVTVGINWYGEADFELVLILFMIPSVAYLLYFFIRIFPLIRRDEL